MIVNSGFRENKIAKALYVLEVDGDIKGMLITHVDDLCWAFKLGYEESIQNILDEFVVKKVEEGKFRFCGKDVEQQDDMSVIVTCKDAIETVDAIHYVKNKRKADDSATEAEIAQMRSVIGPLRWISRQCHPELRYLVSKL